MNPSTRIVITTTLILHILTADMSTLYPYTFLGVLLIPVFLKVPILFILKRLVPLVPFWSVVLVMGFWEVQAPLKLELLIIRTLLPVILVSVLLFKTSVEDLMVGLKELGLPGKVVGVMRSGYSSIEIAGREYKGMRRAILSRGVKIDINLMGKLVGTLVLRSLSRAERINRSMLSRGITGRYPGGVGNWWSGESLIYIIIVSGAVLILRYLT